MDRRGYIISCFAVLGFLTLGGCHGERLTTVIEEPDENGRWRVDGTLIRSYNVTLTQAFDSVLKLSAKKGWVVRHRSSSDYKADVTVKTTELIVIDFSIWAPAGQATDIGVEYDGGNKIGSSQVFTDLERVLPGKRIVVNQP